MNDEEVLVRLNDQFIEACRVGSWDLLSVILAPDFAYIDGATGEVWPMERYIADLRENPAPSLLADEVRIHVADDVAIVSARTSGRPGVYSRYVDTYVKRDGRWLCVHASVWPLVAGRDA